MKLNEFLNEKKRLNVGDKVFFWTESGVDSFGTILPIPDDSFYKSDYYKKHVRIKVYDKGFGAGKIINVPAKNVKLYDWSK